MEIKAGDIVFSKAGRDKSSYFVVMRLSDDSSYAYICDGRKRKTDRPKYKKIKHLGLGMGFSEFISGKIESGDKVTNTELRTELAGYNSAKDAPLLSKEKAAGSD